MIVTRIVQLVLLVGALSTMIYAGRVALQDWHEARMARANARSASTDELDVDLIVERATAAFFAEVARHLPIGTPGDFPADDATRFGRAAYEAVDAYLDLNLSDDLSDDA